MSFTYKKPQQPEDPHSLSIALVGAPNAGKSTLVNWIVNDMVSAISPKSQTTRSRVMGVFTVDDTQLVCLLPSHKQFTFIIFIH